jgi:hypothetical protein
MTSIPDAPALHTADAIYSSVDAVIVLMSNRDGLPLMSAPAKQR